MSEKQFSLAVVKGPSKGRSIQTERKRIAVGTAADNDLVLSDPSLAARHFLVLIDSGRWRIHTISADQSITVDSRWVHPETGARGAIIHAGEEEILLYPGALEAAVVKRETMMRAGGKASTERVDRGGKVQQITSAPVEFLSEDEGAPTVAFSLRKDEVDLVKLSQMATVAGERAPEDLRALARSRLAEERTPVAPSVLKESVKNQPVLLEPAAPRPKTEERTVGVVWVDGAPRPKDDTLLPPPAAEDVREGRRPSKSDTAWDRARRRGPEASALPEVVPEPDLPRMPGADRSVVGARPSEAEAIATPVVSAPESGARPKSEGRNAWGDRVGRAPERKEPAPPPPAREPVNAWGDRPERRSEKSEPARKAWPDAPSTPRGTKPNAWGDGRERASNGAVLEPRGAPERPPMPAAPGLVLDIELLSRRSDDPALSVLREPDGELATSVRLFGTRLEEMMRNLSYRAYMITSAEPLTGKTTTACNLALALAEDTHRRVALVEANFRYPRLAEIMGLPEEHGLIPLLEGRVQVAETVVKLSDRNLVLVPSGGRHTRPAELLASQRFKTLIAELANTVDICLIDAPSVIPFADANLLLPLVDGAFLVVAEKSTRVTWISKASMQLGNARIFGGVYNQLPPKLRASLKRDRVERMRT